MKKVVIFGNGQMAEIVHVYLIHDSTYEVAAFCVDREHLKGESFRSLPVVPFEDITSVYPPSEFSMFIQMSAKQMNRIRAEKYFQAKDKGYELITYISSKATIGPETSIGENCFIQEHNVIQSFAKIGNDVILWAGNHIGHHSAIMDHCFVTSHVVVCGRVMVEPYCYLGVNSTIRDGITIKERCVIGAGALVMRDTKESQVYVGLPGKLSSVASDSVEII